MLYTYGIFFKTKYRNPASYRYLPLLGSGDERKAADQDGGGGRQARAQDPLRPRGREAARGGGVRGEV